MQSEVVLHQAQQLDQLTLIMQEMQAQMHADRMRVMQMQSRHAYQMHAHQMQTQLQAYQMQGPMQVQQNVGPAGAGGRADNIPNMQLPRGETQAQELVQASR